MEIYVLDKNLNRIESPIDLYESFQWNPRFNDVGSFQLDCPLKFFDILQKGLYIENTEDKKHAGVIEYFEKKTNDDGFESLMVKGRMMESIFDRRIALGNYQYQAVQPAVIVSDLLTQNAINPADSSRAIPNLVIGDMPDSSIGSIDYGTSNSHLLNEMLSVCKSSKLGLSVHVNDSNQIQIDLYKGENRTEQANTITTVEFVDINNLIRNGDLSAQLSNWNLRNYGVTAVTGGNVSQYRMKKEKLWDRYWWPPEPEEDEEQEYFEDPLYAGYIYQNVTLNSEHIYYISAVFNNPSATVLGYGIKNGEQCTLSGVRTGGTVRKSCLYVPPESGSYSAVLGYGDFPNEEEFEGTTAYSDGLIVVDLTETFGVGKEPTLDWCDTRIIWSNGVLQYRNETIQFIENPNEPLVFSRERDNVITAEYSKDTTNLVTYIYIKGEGDVTTFVTIGDETGTERIERYLDLSYTIPRIVDGIEIPLSSYIAMLQTEGYNQLEQLVVSELIDIQLYLLNNIQYGKHFQLGDIVSCIDKNIGFSTDLRITGVNQIWDMNGYSISLTLGTPAPSLINTIRLVAKGV